MTEHIKKNGIAIIIQRKSAEEPETTSLEFQYRSNFSEDRVAFAVLLKAKEDECPDLAFRYGCRNQRCGLCAIEINGKPRLGCAAKVNDGDKIGPLKGFPVIRDLIIDRSGIMEQLQLNLIKTPEYNTITPKSPNDSFVRLSRCIGCLSCVSQCPLHAKNFNADSNTERIEDIFAKRYYLFGNPHTFLQIRRMVEDNMIEDAHRKIALKLAVQLGISACQDCDKCSCQVGINLPKEVIAPLVSDTRSLPMQDFI